MRIFIYCSNNSELSYKNQNQNKCKFFEYNFELYIMIWLLIFVIVTLLNRNRNTYFKTHVLLLPSIIETSMQVRFARADLLL